ncbi:MAG: arsenite efflux transporter metallochaperone ArsD [Terrimicrobiaceae bacterium]
MKTLAVYDPPMCCQTGVCGPEVDPELVRMAAFLETLKERGVTVERYNLAHEPLKFVENPEVKALLDDEDSLPAVFVDGKLFLTGRLPDASEQAALLAGLE